MLNGGDFHAALTQRGVGLFTGVPDSLLAGFCAYLEGHSGPPRHVIAANEGGAVALAAGHHLATGQIGLVYMQNSGLGNALNPLVSLADPAVYSVPMLLLVGWRGEPGQADEPQHVTQGRVTLRLLDALEIPHAVLPEDEAGMASCLDAAFASLRERRGPYALVARKGTFAPGPARQAAANPYALSREQAIQSVVDQLDPRDIVVATTGMSSRELFEHRAALGQRHGGDFLTVGSMGHASQIALGIALARPDRQVYCLDGDGALIMHLGSLPIIASQAARNFRHVVLNNGAHDSVGGQPTAGFAMDIPAIARHCGYPTACRADTAAAVAEALTRLRDSDGPALLEIRIRTGARANLGRPTRTPAQNKADFMAFLSA